MSGASDARYERALIETNHEIVRAKNLHGPVDFHGIHEGYAVLLEEVDELWDIVKLNPKRLDVNGELSDYAKQLHRRMLREEAIHVAAMAIRFAAELT